MARYEYDIVIIGSGPAGQKAAMQAAKLGKRVAVIERLPEIGGVSISTATASKTLREAVLHLTGYRERKVYGESYAVKQDITMSDLMLRTRYVMHQEGEILRSQLARNRVETIAAEASFIDRHTINLVTENGKPDRTITAEKVIIAVGTYSTMPPVVFVDGRLIFVSDDVLNLTDLPRTLTIVGAGAIGLEYCGTFAAVGVRVTLVDRNPRLLPFADDELTDTLVYHLRQRDVTFIMNGNVFDIEYLRDDYGDRVRVMLEGGKQIVSDAVMYCVGRTGATQSLNLEAVGVEIDERGRLSVDENYQTNVEGIYAVGGVIGFPDLSSTSQMQGRLAVRHAAGIAANQFPDLVPYTVKTIPEVAMVGMTEAQLMAEGIPYEVGKAEYHENVNSIIKGDDAGFLKLLFHLESRKLLGVHIIGEGAAELIHIGQAVIAHEGTIDYFVDSVTSNPTLAECYPAAALNGINRLGL
ncbi:MAG: Si-specific NAD(P)(+) transhydrogenase [Chloroflexi bacterium]|nr:Si-specific NAD(P)(+) transhydrogenase [Chloroflexota bacterium]